MSDNRFYILLVDLEIELLLYIAIRTPDPFLRPVDHRHHRTDPMQLSPYPRSERNFSGRHLDYFIFFTCSTVLDVKMLGDHVH